MQRQQEYTKMCNHPGLHYYPSMGADSLLYTGTAMSDYSQDDNLSIQKMSMAPSVWHQAEAVVSVLCFKTDKITAFWTNSCTLIVYAKTKI